VVVTNVFEFVLAASLFSFPGLALLALTMISSGRDRSAVRKRGAGPQPSRTFSSLAPPFTVQVFGPYEPEQVQTEPSDSIRPTSPSIERIIDQSWNALTALGSADGRMVFNGQLGRLVRTSATPQSLAFEVASTTFREFVGTNVDSAAAILASHDRSWLANPLGTSAVLISSDGFLIFGRRSERVAFHAGCVHPFGGIVEKADQSADGRFDVLRSIFRELKEEAGIGRDEVSSCVLTGLVTLAPTGTRF
jgi:hypothetical protein